MSSRAPVDAEAPVLRPRNLSLPAVAFMVTVLMLLFLVVASLVLPVPYVVLRPGPAEDTLGAVKGEHLILISGHKTYPTDGKLHLTTISYQGGPGGRPNLVTAIQGWIDSEAAVVPEETIFPRGTDADAVDEQNEAEMVSSQHVATDAALGELNIPVGVEVGDTDKGKPAHGVLRRGDKILAVAGQDVRGLPDVKDTILGAGPGKTLEFTVQRGEKKTSVKVGTVATEDGEARIGATLKTTYPFDVKIQVGDIGGPSAGLMFSLGIVDKLTPTSLTGGRNIAGTGTIVEDGSVGPIGGVRQKMMGARAKGATVFLIPADNCAEAVQDVPDGLRLVKVEDLHGAVEALEGLRSGRADLPSCAASR